jgi:uncharacterized DUF497 family protein
VKIDWDKDTGNWRIFDESDVELARAQEVVISGTTILVQGEWKRVGDRIVIKGRSK